MAKTHAGTMVNIKGGARVGHVAYRVVQARDGESMPIAELANDAQSILCTLEYKFIGILDAKN